MVTVIDSGNLQKNGQPSCATLAGLSTDEKPIGQNGWMFIEMDSGKFYLFSEETSEWIEFGGSGGGGGSNIAMVTITDETGGTPFTLYVPNKYQGEVYEDITNTDIDGSAQEIILTNGSATLSYNSGATLSFSVSGSITNNGDGTLTITGDGSITISIDE